jgi:hypothetical protein
MRVVSCVAFVLVAGFAVSAAVAQVPTPGKITDKVPDKFVSPTPTPAPKGPTEYKPRMPEVPPSLDKVVMESFVSEPAQIPPGTTQVLLRVTVKNVTNSGLATGYVLNGLKVKIFRTLPLPEILEMETTVNNLALGVPQSVGARVNIGPGVREYIAKVDPDNTLKEPIPQRVNNESRLRLTIPQVSGQQAPPPGSAPRMETQFLDYQKAKNAGAQFTDGIDGPNGLCLNVGQFNSVPWVDDHSQGVLFSADCTAAPNGARATPEVFTGFRLKHGWRVKDYAIGRNEKSGQADWQWRQTPSKGTDDPSMRMHVFASPLAWIKVQVKVEIEGPAGTNPYQ